MVCGNTTGKASQACRSAGGATVTTHSTSRRRESNKASIYEDTHWEFPSETNPSKTYRVSQRKDNGQLVCSCPKFIFQRVPLEKKKPCKHIQQVQAGMATPADQNRKPIPKIVFYRV